MLANYSNYFSQGGQLLGQRLCHKAPPWGRHWLALFLILFLKHFGLLHCTDVCILHQILEVLDFRSSRIKVDAG